MERIAIARGDYRSGWQAVRLCDTRSRGKPEQAHLHSIASIVAPMWDGFDEPGHLAYILYIDDHGRVPGYTELSFPTFFLAANPYLPSAVGVGAPSFAQWHSMSQRDRDRFRSEADRLSRDPDRYRIYASSNYQRQQGPFFYYLAAKAGISMRPAHSKQQLSLRLPRFRSTGAAPRGFYS